MRQLVDRLNAANALIEFAEAWQSLGNSIQEQATDVVNGYLAMGVWDKNQHFREVVYEQNPGAMLEARQKLRDPIERMGHFWDECGEDILDALEEAILVYNEGVKQQTADHIAAEGK